MDSYTDKGKAKEDLEDSETPTIRIILKSPDVKNLEYVSSNIIALSKEKGFSVKGPRFMPNKILRVTTRKSPCGNGIILIYL